MNSRLFLISLVAVMVSVHLFRFPHLILENGGGAFLILYFLMMNVFAFPLLVAEKVLDNLLGRMDIRSLISVRKSRSVSVLDQFFVTAWFGLRLIGLICFLWFFLYVGSSSLVYMIYFLKVSMQVSSSTLDIPTVPSLAFSQWGALLWVALSFSLFLARGEAFLKFCGRWVLPFCFFILFGLLLKILVGVNDFEALKTLFYPDFSALNYDSLRALVGHSLASLFIGFGFYTLVTKTVDGVDTIEMFIQAVIRCLVLAVVIGVMALPMIEQVSETPFGTAWLFEILPRWLSYGEFGHYYCALFFLVLGVLSLQIAVALHVVIKNNTTLLYRLKSNSTRQWMVNGMSLLVNLAVVVWMQNSLLGWSGKSLLLQLDDWIVNDLIPLYSLMMIWVVYRYTQRHEREAVFSQQEIFYHNRFFYKIWEKTTLWMVPAVILLGWLLSLIGS